MSQIPPVWFVWPGRYPGTRGTPLAVRWLAEAWSERGHPCTVWTADGRDSHSPCQIPVRRVGHMAAKVDAGPSLTRAFGAVRLAQHLKHALVDHPKPRPVLHAHHVDASLIARFATKGQWLAHRHTRLRDEMPAYWPKLSRLARIVGHALDSGHMLTNYRVSFSQDVAFTPIDPVVPRDEVRRMFVYQREPRSHVPTAIYLGNGDRYQNLEELLRATGSWPTGIKLEWLTHETPPPRFRDSIAQKRIHLVTGNIDTLLRRAARAWWALLPRRLAAGYPYKLLVYGLLGLPVLASRAWPGPVQVEIVDDWDHAFDRRNTDRPPERRPVDAIDDSRERTLDVLSDLYQALSVDG